MKTGHGAAMAESEGTELVAVGVGVALVARPGLDDREAVDASRPVLGSESTESGQRQLTIGLGIGRDGRSVGEQPVEGTTLRAGAGPGDLAIVFLDEEESITGAETAVHGADLDSKQGSQ